MFPASLFNQIMVGQAPRTVMVPVAPSVYSGNSETRGGEKNPHVAWPVIQDMLARKKAGKGGGLTDFFYDVPQSAITVQKLRAEQTKQFEELARMYPHLLPALYEQFPLVARPSSLFGAPEPPTMRGLWGGPEEPGRKK